MVIRTAGRRVRPASAFTLVELLVVMAIISILAALLAVGVASLSKRAKEEKTRGLLHRIEVGMQTYVTRFLAYPDMAGNVTSEKVHLTMAGATTPTGPLYQRTEIDPANPAIFKYVTAPPIMEFRQDEVQGGNAASVAPPRPIIDPWGNPLQYTRPGLNHQSDPLRGKDNRSSFDLWSQGSVFGATNGLVADDIANFRQ